MVGSLSLGRAPQLTRERKARRQSAAIHAALVPCSSELQENRGHSEMSVANRMKKIKPGSAPQLLDKEPELCTSDSVQLTSAVLQLLRRGQLDPGQGMLAVQCQKEQRQLFASVSERQTQQEHLVNLLKVNETMHQQCGK